MNSVMLVNEKFNSQYFVRPTNPTKERQAFMLRLDRESIEINNAPQKEHNRISVIEKY